MLKGILRKKNEKYMTILGEWISYNIDKSKSDGQKKSRKWMTKNKMLVWKCYDLQKKKIKDFN